MEDAAAALRLSGKAEEESDDENSGHAPGHGLLV
jgi:hypothetical protein